MMRIQRLHSYGRAEICQAHYTVARNETMVSQASVRGSISQPLPQSSYAICMPGMELTRAGSQRCCLFCSSSQSNLVCASAPACNGRVACSITSPVTTRSWSKERLSWRILVVGLYISLDIATWQRGASTEPYLVATKDGWPRS